MIFVPTTPSTTVPGVYPGMGVVLSKVCTGECEFLLACRPCNSRKGAKDPALFKFVIQREREMGLTLDVKGGA